MKTIRDGFIDGLIEAAEHMNELVVLSTNEKHIAAFARRFPKRLVQTNSIGIACGMTEKKIPFLFTSHLSKQWEHVTASAHGKHNLKLVDMNPNSLDIGSLRLLSAYTILVPCDYHEARKSALAAATHTGPLYVALFDSSEQITTHKTPFIIGKTEIMRAGADCTIVSHGPLLASACLAAEKLSKQEINCTVLNCHTLSPIDKHAILASTRITGCVVTIEYAEQNGLGTAVCEILSQNMPAPVRMLIMPDDSRIINAVRSIILQKCQNICTHPVEILPRHPEQSFHARDGTIIRSIWELQRALISMSDDTFSHHCNTHKNDFLTWIQDVFKEEKLARELQNVHTRIGMLAVLSRQT